jgi:isochorismate synthase
VIHLKTDISGKITTTSIHEIISSLHPTPAVSGVPRNDAQFLIQMLEHHSRELYTGFFGNFSNNSARLYVNLRCAQVIDNEVFLYLGGGFTLESIPELEFDETENKSKTLIKYMELVSRK